MRWTNFAPWLDSDLNYEVDKTLTLLSPSLTSPTVPPSPNLLHRNRDCDQEEKIESKLSPEDLILGIITSPSLLKSGNMAPSQFLALLLNSFCSPLKPEMPPRPLIRPALRLTRLFVGARF